MSSGGMGGGSYNSKVFSQNNYGGGSGGGSNSYSQNGGYGGSGGGSSGSNYRQQNGY